MPRFSKSTCIIKNKIMVKYVNNLFWKFNVLKAEERLANFDDGQIFCVID